MIRTPARKEIAILTPDEVKENANFLYVAGQTKIKKGSTSKCILKCVETGEPKEIKICPVVPETCECPYFWGMEIHTLPDLQNFGIEDTFRIRKFYEWGNPDGSTPTKAQVAENIVKLINADPSAPVTAEYDATGCSGEPAIILTGKKNGNKYEVYAVASTITVVAPGVEDGLTPETLYKMFPIQHGKFGEIPPATFCANYCLLSATITDCCSTISDAFDSQMDRAIQGVQYEILWAIPKAILTPTNQAETDMLATLTEYFPCLEQSSGSGE